MTTADVSGSNIAKVLEWVGLVITPFATLTSLLYYFGWVRTNAVFGYFGIETNLLAYSPQDYLLRSAGVAFRPCAFLLLGIAATLIADRIVGRARGPAVGQGRILLVETAILGSVILVPSIAVLLGWLQTDNPMLAAVGIVAGAILLELVATYWPLAAHSPPERILRRATIAGAIVLGLFWSFAIYAQRTGERVAESLANNPAAMSKAVVYSKDDLGISGPGVTMTKAAGTAALPYRYSGLRLFVYRNRHWFLLPADWRRDNEAYAVILPDADSIRVELRP